MLEVAAELFCFPIVNDPLGDADMKSFEKSIRSTTIPDGPGNPPPNQPKSEFPVADKYPFAAVNGPLVVTVDKSLEKSIRSTVEKDIGVL